jgi:hypothetical protein
MILASEVAQVFIHGYRAILLELAGPRQIVKGRDLLAKMADGRRRLAEEPTCIDIALEGVKARGIGVAPQVEQAIRKLRLDNWVYLKDTGSYSVFLDSKAELAVGVVGLTDRLRDLVGGSGVAMETGVVECAGQYVCDGLIADFVYLGPNYRRSFSVAYQAMRKSGRFQRRPGT